MIVMTSVLGNSKHISTFFSDFIHDSESSDFQSYVPSLEIRIRAETILSNR